MGEGDDVAATSPRYAKKTRRRGFSSMTDSLNARSMENPTDRVDLEASLHSADHIPDTDELAKARVEGDMGDVPQAYTESYGTGVQPLPGYNEGGRTIHDRQRNYNEADAVLTGGDIDANYEQANAVGDESVGGTAPTPDMDIVDDLGRAVGLEMDDKTFLMTNDLLENRDERRWELEPKSSEDYEERQER